MWTEELRTGEGDICVRNAQVRCSETQNKNSLSSLCTFMNIEAQAYCIYLTRDFN